MSFSCRCSAVAPCGNDVNEFLFGGKVVENGVDSGRSTGGIKKSCSQPGFAFDTACEEDIVVIVGCGNDFRVSLFLGGVPVELGPSGLAVGKGT